MKVPHIQVHVRCVPIMLTVSIFLLHHAYTHSFTFTHSHTPLGPAQLELWRFLLELLLISANTNLIQWTDGEFEFQIKSPTEVAQLWGQVTNNPNMNYEKLAVGLRYYFTKGIMTKVPGKRLTFKYAGNVRNYVQMRRSQMISSHEEIVVVE